MSAEAARKTYSISDLKSLKENVEDAVEQALEIREAVEQLSRVKEQCIIEELGIHVCDANTDSDETESSESIDDDRYDDVESDDDYQGSDISSGPVIQDSNVALEDSDLTSALPANEHLLTMLQEKSYNWFVFVEELNMMLYNYSQEELNHALLDFLNFLPSSGLCDQEQKLIEQSYQAFLITDCRRAAGESCIATDSESDDPEDWVGVGEGLTEIMKSLVLNEKKKQKKRDRRMFLKLMAEKSLLKRKVPKRASKLLKQFPNLGKDIEDFVHEN